MIFFRKKKKEAEEIKEAITLTGSPIGKAVLVDVFGLLSVMGKPRLIILGICLTEGVIYENSILKLPDNRLLRAIRLELKLKKVPMARAPQCIGVHIEGIGWKPSKEELLKFRQQVIEIYKRL